MTERNWAGNLAYSAAGLARPASVDELGSVVRGAERVKALGSRHSFNTVADTDGTLIQLDRMPDVFEIDADRRTLRVGAGARYGDIAERLHAAGWALGNLASLPHISIAGAVATGTHGSGVRNRSLAAAVAGLELVLADGSARTSRRGDADFDGMVVSLGALGIVTALELDIEPSYDIEQGVYEWLPMGSVLAELDEILSLAYSVSLFIDYSRPWEVRQCWVKRRVDGGRALPADVAGSPLLATQAHPLPGAASDPTTEQGTPGPWYDRLPHFRLGFVPSSGEELQSEYFVPRAAGAAAIEAVLAQAAAIAPVLQVSEVRAVAADDLWLSPAYGRDVIGLHFTWNLDPAGVSAAAAVVERALEPFDPVAHWGKITSASFPNAARFERMPDFRDLVSRFDPEGRFANPFLRRTLGEIDSRGD